MDIAVVAQWAAGLIGVGLLVIGGSAVIAPVAASRGYGVVVAEQERSAAAYTAAAGWRDVALGAAIVALAVTADGSAVAVAVLAGTLLPLGDVLVLLRHKVSRPLSYFPHAFGAVAMAATGLALLVL